MSSFTQRNRAVALLILRLLLGIIFLMQGYGKVFKWGIEQLYKNAFSPYQEQGLPEALLWLIAYYTSYVELIAGALLILGLGRDWALYLLGSVLLIVSFGHGLATPIWPLDDVLFRALLLVTILLLPVEYDTWRLERLIYQVKKT